MRKILTALLFCALSFVFTAQTRVQAQDLTVGSYNIRYRNDGDAERGNAWENRCPVIVQLIGFNDLDIFGAQEVLHSQLEDLLAGLPEYGYIGVGRDDGRQAGEYAPIFYKKDKFQLLESGYFWLSTETAYPNTGWDASLPRICTWGMFRERDTGFEFMFFNTHFDHVGKEARSESAKLIMEKTRELGAGRPSILTGDFNVDQDDPSYHVIADSGYMQDAYTITAKRYATNGTFNNFRADTYTDRRIDHIFVTGEFKVKRYAILVDSYRTLIGEGAEPSRSRYEARVPSDHFPVVIGVGKR